MASGVEPSIRASPTTPSTAHLRAPSKPRFVPGLREEQAGPSGVSAPLCTGRGEEEDEVLGWLAAQARRRVRESSASAVAAGGAAPPPERG